MAFQQSSPPSVPTVAILQACEQNTFIGGASGSGGCHLSNVQAGNKVIITQITLGVPGSGTYSSASTETQTYVAGTWGTVTYGGNAYQSIISYSDLASSHSTFNSDTTYASCPGCTAISYYAIEVTGLTTGADTGSAAWCSAITCNYTTLSSNEFTIMTAGNSLNTAATPGVTAIPTQMTPGNSFLPMAFSYGSTNPQVVGQNMDATKITVSSGSNTGSYSQSGSTSPIMSLLSFGVIATTGNLRHGFIF